MLNGLKLIILVPGCQVASVIIGRHNLPTEAGRSFQNKLRLLTETLSRCIRGTGVTGSQKGFAALHQTKCKHHCHDQHRHAATQSTNVSVEVLLRFFEAMLQSTDAAAFSFDDLTRLHDCVRKQPEAAVRDNQSIPHSPPAGDDILPSHRPPDSVSLVTKSVFDDGME